MHHAPTMNKVFMMGLVQHRQTLSTTGSTNPLVLCPFAQEHIDLAQHWDMGQPTSPGATGGGAAGAAAFSLLDSSSWGAGEGAVWACAWLALAWLDL